MQLAAGGMLAEMLFQLRRQLHIKERLCQPIRRVI